MDPDTLNGCCKPARDREAKPVAGRRAVTHREVADRDDCVRELIRMAGAQPVAVSVGALVIHRAVGMAEEWQPDDTENCARAAHQS